MLALSFMIPFSSKISADSASSRRAFYIKVWPKKRMPFLAMSSILNRKVHSAHRVYLPSSDFKMSWIHASFISAKMVALKMLGNWSKKEFPGKTVSIFLDAVRYRVASVSSAMTSGSPYPASGTTFDGNLLSKTLRQSVEVNC